MGACFYTTRSVDFPEEVKAVDHKLVQSAVQADPMFSAVIEAWPIDP